MSDNDFAVVAVVLALAAVAGLVANRLKQPLLVVFIGVGVLVGPAGTGWVTGADEIDLFARLGISVLLFLVGLKLDVQLVRSTGAVALAAGVGQIVFTSILGYGIALALGMDAATAFYVAVAVTFSSTIVVVKLLSDQRELEDLHGRIALGVLIVQDLAVVLLMIGITAFGQDTDERVATEIVAVVVKGLVLLAVVGVLARWVLPRVLHLAARSPELLVLFAVAWAVGLAATSESLEFSTEVGAFLAGVALASTPYREAIGARLVSLRDFLVLFFFLDLGARLEFTDTASQVADAVVLSVFVLAAKPFVVMLITGWMRYPAKVSFRTGLAMGQISEFSLILAALGLSLGHIDNATMSLVTMVGIITIGVSTYVIVSSGALYDRWATGLARLERSRPRPAESPEREPVDVIVYGLGRYGGALVRALVASGHRVMGVDFDPHAVTAHAREGIDAVYGDAENLDFLERLPLGRARWFVSTIPSRSANLTLMHGLRHHGFDGRIAVTAHTAHDAHHLEEARPTAVLRPFSDAAHQVVALIEADGA